MDKPILITKEINDCSIIYANGYLNGLGAERLEDECEAILQKGIKKIILNFKKTELINSIGISILISIIEKTKNVKGHLSFCNLNKIHAETFEMLGLTKYVPVFSSEDEALLTIQNR